MSIPAKAYAAFDPHSPLVPWEIARREPGPYDVQIQILYCGVCHSDLHQARNEWKNTIYPCVPGHEIVGRVVAVGERSPASRSAISPASAAWSTAAAIATPVRVARSNTAVKGSSARTTAEVPVAKTPTVATPKSSW